MREMREMHESTRDPERWYSLSMSPTGRGGFGAVVCAAVVTAAVACGGDEASPAKAVMDPDAGCEGDACGTTDDCATNADACAPTPTCDGGEDGCAPSPPTEPPTVFAGPFPSWIDVKKDFGAVGDGVTDDTEALQQALASAAQNGKPYVVYLPSGTYRISKTLRLQYQHVVLYGEGPSTTTLLWAGASGQDMVLANGVGWSIWGRLAFDGAGIAGGGLHFSWDTKGPGEYSTQGVTITDAVFRNLGKGIVGGSTPPGQMDSDVGIFRTRFESCSVAGLSTESWNALDYWVFDSAFVGNARGLTNRYGGGNFNVRNSLFTGSTVADVDIGKNAIFLGLRGNTSIGSKQFVHIDTPYDAFSTTLQQNRVVDTIDPVAVEANYLGALVLLDNHIRSRAGAKGPAVSLNAEYGTGDFLSMGNRYTVESAESVTGPTVRSHSSDHSVVDATTIPDDAPTLPTMPPHATGKIIDVPAGANAAALQAAIDEAATHAGRHPVIHLSAGEYVVTEGLVVPPDLDVTITGDGWGTIVWGKDLTGPVFRLRGPSRAVLRDMKINASTSSDANVVTSAEAIRIENADQEGARVYGEVDTFLHNRGVDVLADGLRRTHVDLHGAFLGRGGDLAAHAIGAGPETKGRIAIFGGTSTAWRNPGGAMYRVSDGGRMVVEDMWYEANEGPTVVRLGASDSGSFTLNGAQLSQYSGSGQSVAQPVVDVDGFPGQATILGALFAFPDGASDRFPIVRNESSQTRFLGFGLSALEGGAKTPYTRRTGAGGVVSYASNKLDTQSEQGNVTLPDSGDPLTTPFLEAMLASLRATMPSPFSTAPPGVTNVGLEHLTIQYATNGVHVVP